MSGRLKWLTLPVARPFWLGGLLGILVGCAQPTYYAPAVDGFGYTEQQIGPERYQVTFAGNHKTRRETAHQYVLFRAAEIADSEGYPYVAVNGQSQRIERFGDLRDRPTQRVDLGLEDSGGGQFGRNRNGDNGVRSKVERYQAILDVTFYKNAENIPASTHEYYETSEVLSSLDGVIEYEGQQTTGKYITDPSPATDAQQ